MIKRLVVLAMVALVALVIVTPAWAAATGPEGASGGDPQFFSLRGIVDSTDADSITVQVLGGTRAVWTYKEGPLTVSVTADTAYFRCTCTDNGRVPIDFDEVVVGAIVNIQGTVDEGVFTADRVIVDVDCP